MKKKEEEWVRVFRRKMRGDGGESGNEKGKRHCQMAARKKGEGKEDEWEKKAWREGRKRENQPTGPTTRFHITTRFLDPVVSLPFEVRSR